MIKTPFMLLTLLVVNSLVVNSLVHAQDPESRPALELPDSDIFLFEFDESNGKLEISKGANITHRLGYDNQPWFTPDSQSLLFSAANVAVDRTDIYEYFIASGETKQVTDSPNQEYSPQLAPDEQTLSFVTDGETANQSIWFTQRGSGVEKWLLSNQSEREPVGYYSWNHRTGYILYWSRYGYSLRLVHETKKLSHYVTGNAPPTTPYIIPGTDKFSFVHQQGNGEVWIKELDPETRSIRPLTAIVGHNKNYGWTPGGRIVMAEGDKLHWWSPDSGGWQMSADLTQHGLTTVTRVAVSPNGKRIAIVGLPTKD